MKPLMIALVMALSSPVLAQSFEPTGAAVRYCSLRQAGMPSRPAMRAAMLEYWDSNRQPAKVRRRGEEFTQDQITFVDLTMHCG